MNATQEKNLLANQSGLARKVYEALSAEEARGMPQILKAMGENSDRNAVRACLGAMVEAGLLRELSGLFQRHTVRRAGRPRRVAAEAPAPVAAEVPIPEPILGRKVHPIPDLPGTPGELALEPPPAGPAGAIEVIGGLVSELQGLSDEFAGRIKALAKKLEDTALTIAQEHEANAANLDKLKQVTDILKNVQ